MNYVGQSCIRHGCLLHNKTIVNAEHNSQSSPLRWLGFILLCLVLLVPFVMGHKSDSTTALHADLPVKKLVLISPHSERVRTEFARAFSEWTTTHRGHRTEFEWLSLGGTSEGVRYVKSEFERSPTGIRVDLFFGGGMEPYLQFKSADLLEACSVPPDTLAQIPKELDGVPLFDPDGYWFGTCLGGFGIIFNKKVLEWTGIAEPQTWSDLAEPKLFTWVGSGDPRSSGSIHMAYEIILQASGWETGWSNIVAMCANTRNFSRSGGEVPKDAALGEVACGTAIDVYAWRQIAESGDRMAFVLPAGMTIVTPDSIGILKGAPERELAAEFIAFVLSEEGQRLWYLKQGAPGGPVQFELNRMPLLPGRISRASANASVQMDPFASTNSNFAYNPELGAARWGILNDLMGACIIDTHPELQAAWTHVNSGLAKPSARQALLAPPLSESNLLLLAATQWANTQIRSETKAAWAEAARTRYRAAME